MDERISPVKLFEKVITLDGKVTAAHGRMDKLETSIRDDLVEIKKDLKDIMGWMNRGKGWAAASLVLSSAVGGVVATLLTFIFKH